MAGLLNFKNATQPTNEENKLIYEESINHLNLSCKNAYDYIINDPLNQLKSVRHLFSGSSTSSTVRPSFDVIHQPINDEFIDSVILTYDTGTLTHSDSNARQSKDDWLFWVIDSIDVCLNDKILLKISRRSVDGLSKFMNTQSYGIYVKNISVTVTNTKKRISVKLLLKPNMFDNLPMYIRAGANKSLEFSDNKIKNAINILINESNSLISSTKYTLLEKFAFYKLISESLLISMVRNDGSIINYDASIISPIHAMMKKLIVAMGNNYDVLDLLMQTIDLFYDDDNVYDSSLFLTKEFITFVNKLRIIKDNASSELNVLTPFGKSVDAINKSPRKDTVYNSLITPMKELLLAEYNDIEKTYKKYTMPLINENDLLKIDIANMVESISFIHNEVIDVKITGDDLKCLFGSDLVQIHAVVKNNNGNVEQAFCSLRMGLTSDFRTNPNIPLLFDIGRFTATINFKSELLVTHHLNPIKIQSYISYESVMFENEHTISESIRIGEMIYNIIDLYRVPISHKFNITTGNGKNPFDLLIPINKYGLSFARALSISKPIYSTKQTLGNLATYDIMIGDSDDQYSKNLLYNTNEKKFTNHDNETYTIYMGNAAMLFSGQHSGSKNICINLKKTDASRALKIETSNDYIVIPLVEFLLKKSISQSIPGRSFKLIKQAQANIND